MSAVLPTGGETQQSPAVRLAHSRERLREALREAAVTRRGASAARAASPGTAWLDSLKSIPGAGAIIETLSAWWARHPLRIAVSVAEDAAKAALRPYAQRHPLALVAGAMLVGVLFVWARPWHGLLKPALFAGLLPQLFARAMAQVPSRSWMAVLTSLVQEQQRRPPPAEPPG